jgi:THO complex subunit 4
MVLSSRCDTVANILHSQPKAQPKSAATVKHGANAANGAKAGAAGKPARNKPRRGRNSRPSKKTAEELDSEMADYFVANTNTENGGAPAAGPAPAAATNGDAAMDDDIL